MSGKGPQVSGYLISLLQPHLTRHNTLQGPFPWGPSAQSCQVGIFNCFTREKGGHIYHGLSLSLVVVS